MLFISSYISFCVSVQLLPHSSQLHTFSRRPSAQEEVTSVEANGTLECRKKKLLLVSMSLLDLKQSVDQ